MIHETAGDEIYVVALLGESPGVLTELLWYLVAVERLRIAGCEIWTTAASIGEGTTRGLRAIGPEAWDTLRQALGADADRVPTLPVDFTVEHDIDAPLATGTCRVLVPAVGDRPLADTGTVGDAASFSRWAHARMEVVTRGHPRVLGSLAGGRKAMSAVLHSAFTLYARRDDRLCHVLLHPTVEGRLREDRVLAAYRCPTTTLYGIPPERQVTVFDVPFFSATDFVSIRSRRQARDLLDQARKDQISPPPVIARVVTIAVLPRMRVTFSFAPAVPMLRATAILYAQLLTGGPATAEELALRTNDLVAPAVGVVADPTANLRKLSVDFERAIGGNARLAGLVPRLKDDRWWLDGADLDLTAIEPEALYRRLY